MRLALRPADPAAAQALALELGVSATLAQVLLHRGVADPERARTYLAPKLAQLTDPATMADRGVAAERLARAVTDGELIAVFGDYDVDGTTSAAVLADILEALGGRVVVEVAKRFEGGYGFSEAALGRVMAHGPTVVVTCDCGSSDHPRLASLRAAGVDAIVVDHHLVPEEPLPVVAFLNPHRPDCGFAFKDLCSAGLALSLGAAVRAALGASLDLRRYLDLVALGTIADVVPLHGDNRVLVRAGLQLLSGADARPGIAALREIAKVRAGTQLGAIDVAFRLTPRLNAPGRLGDQSVTLRLLRSRDPEEARAIAGEIEKLNDERKRIEAAVTAAALAQAREVYGSTPSAGVVVGGEGWHPGVVGISAARLVDELGVPAVVVGFDAGVGHGSCRTPPGYRLYDALQVCASELVRFGGHQAASGVTLEAARLDGFREAFGRATAAQAQDAPAEPAAPVVDLQLGDGQFAIPTAGELAGLEPLGEQNPEPRFHIPRATLKSLRTVGEDHLKLELQVDGRRMSAFGFRMASEGRGLGPGSQVEVLGTIRPDSWRGGDAVELRLEALAPV